MVAAVGVFALATACDDQAFGPPGGTRLSIVPRLTLLGATDAGLPINHLRLLAHDASSLEVIGSFDRDVDPNAASWDADVTLSLPGSGTTQVEVSVELIHAQGGEESVEWSGMVAVEVTPGAKPAPVAAAVYRGPLSNLGVTSVGIPQADTTLVEGDTLSLSADVVGGGTGVVVYWSSSDTLVATVGAGGKVTTRLPGTARVYATAGPRADSVDLTVLQRWAGIGVADTVRFGALGEQKALGAAVVDPRGNPVLPAPALTLTIADTSVVRSLGAGQLQAVATGTTSVQIAAADSQSIARTATLVVQQVAANVQVTPPVDSVGIGASVRFSASASDALGNAVPGASFTWSSNATGVATVDATGLVTGVAGGSATITATSGSASGSATIFVETTAGGATCADAGTTHAANVVSNQTWTRASSPHFVPASLSVDSSAVLTIQPGALVCMGPYTALYFSTGASLSAIGTAQDPIRFEPTDGSTPWYGLYMQDTPADTSRIANAVLSYAGYGYAVYGATTHPIHVDSTRFRQLYSEGLLLYGPGSRVRQVVVDTVTSNSGSYAVALGDSVVATDVTIRDASGIGLYLIGRGVRVARALVQDTRGYGVYLSGVDIRLDTVRVLNSTSDGIYGNASNQLAGASAVRVTGGQAHGWVGSINDLAYIAPTAASQDSLLGNAMDTLVVQGGYLRAASVTVRPDVPWRIEGTLVLDSAGVMTALPGARIVAGNYAYLYTQNGGRLVARGSAAQPIRIVNADPANPWYGLYVASTAGDTTWLTNARLDGGRSNPMVVAYTPMIIDSVRISRPVYGGIGLFGAGSSVSRSVVDSVQTAGYIGIRVGANVALVQDTVRSSAGVGVRIEGANARIQGGLITGSAGVGLDMSSVVSLDTTSVAPRVIGSGSYGARLSLHALGVMFPTAALQDSLAGNGAADTIAVVGGVTNGRTIQVRPDMPWRAEGYMYFDSASVLSMSPGASIAASGYVDIQFRTGGNLQALGTAAQPIRFTTTDPTLRWYGLYFTGTPTDTSRLRHVLVENGGDGNGSIWAASPHAVRVDSSRIRNSNYSAVSLFAAGSSITGSVIDTTITAGYPAVRLTTGTAFIATTVRGAAGIGVRVEGNGARIAGGRIENGADIGLETSSTSYGLDPASTAPRIVGNARYPVRLSIPAMATLFPDSASQDSLLGNGIDTVAMVGGVVYRGTAVVRPDLPWRLESYAYFDSTSVLTVRPGGSIASSTAGAQLVFRSGSTLRALGTAARPVTFTTTDPTAYWYGMQFQDAPTDTSRLVHALVENGGYTGNGPIYAVGTHTVVVDSSRIRNSQYRAAYLGSPGSMIRWTTVDTTLATSTSYPAIDLAGANTSIVGGTIRGAGSIGLQVQTSSLAETSVVPRIVGSGGYPLRTTIQGYAALFDTRALQDSLVGNLNGDTVDITSSQLLRDTVLVGSSLPWRVENTLYFDSTSLVIAEPGASVAAGTAGTQLLFRFGSTLRALGTAAQPVRFTTTDPTALWYGLQFQDAPTDTSRLLHVLVENGGYTGNGPINALNTHVVVVDSSRVRNSQYRAIRLASPGSMVRWTTVDTTFSTSQSYPAVELVAPNTMIVGGTIRGAGWVGLQINTSALAYGSVVPRIVGSGSYPVRTSIQGFAALFDTRALQDSVLGNVNGDTVLIESTTLVRDTVLVGSSLPWRLESIVYMDSLSLMTVEPGGSVVAGSTSGQIQYRSGSVLKALGTAANRIRFTTADPAGSWYGLQFQDAPADTSRIVNAIVENGGISGNGPIYTTGSHVLIVDSTLVRNSQYRAVSLNSPGSMLRWSTVDTTTAPSSSYPAVQIGAAGITVRNTRIRGAAYDGLQVAFPAAVDSIEVNGAGRYGVYIQAAAAGMSLQNSNLINNGFAASGAAIYFNSTSGRIAATNNWWGNAAGDPGSNAAPSGSGSVNAVVDTSAPRATPVSIATPF